MRTAAHLAHRKRAERRDRRSDLVIQWGDNLPQVAVVFVSFFFLLKLLFWGKEICLTSYLSNDVGSLICLLLPSLFLLKPAVSVDCPKSLKPEEGWREEKKAVERRRWSTSLCGHTGVQRTRAMGCRHTRRRSYTPAQTQINWFLSFPHMHVHAGTQRPNRSHRSRWETQMWGWMDWWTVFITFQSAF